MKTTTAEREEAVADLRAAIKPGDTLHTILRHRLSSIVGSTDLPSFGGEGEPLRVLIDNETDKEVCAIRSDAGPVTVGPVTAEEAIARWAAPMDEEDSEYWQDEMRATLRQ